MFLKPIGHKNDSLQYQEGVYRLFLWFQIYLLHAHQWRMLIQSNAQLFEWRHDYCLLGDSAKLVC